MKHGAGHDSRPHVLLITADHWSGLHLGCAGNAAVATPTVDWLAFAGTHFPQATSACPVCVPARRTLMSGLSMRACGNRTFPELGVPPLAQYFRDAGYQAYAVGKLHTTPQRDRLGFDDVLLNEEGRHEGTMTADDWEMYLAERGHGGMAYAAGGANNCYNVTPWHLPDECHQTNWTAREMCRMIRRRDPRRPGFWYLSFAAPHPPLWPLRSYLEQYLSAPIDEPVVGDWVESFLQNPPRPVATKMIDPTVYGAPPHWTQLARRAFYAMITHVDHQLRVVLGTLREEGLLDNTIILFTSDHGDMLGDHRMWAKTVFYEGSCRVPFVVVPPLKDETAARNVRDDRLVELRDVLPTLLDMAGLEIPAHAEGLPVLGGERRQTLFCEHGDGVNASRMLREDRWKLIYYPEGNRFQLFDLREDPRECRDRSGDPESAEIEERLRAALAEELSEKDAQWIEDGVWKGLPVEPGPVPRSRLSHQKGIRFP